MIKLEYAEKIKYLEGLKIKRYKESVILADTYHLDCKTGGLSKIKTHNKIGLYRVQQKKLNGYMYCSMPGYEKGLISVHVLIAVMMGWFNRKEPNYHNVNHKDFNKINNRLWNLDVVPLEDHANHNKVRTFKGRGYGETG